MVSCISRVSPQLSVHRLLCSTFTESLCKWNALKSAGFALPAPHPPPPHIFILNFVLSLLHSSKDLSPCKQPLRGSSFPFRRRPVSADRCRRMSAGGTLENQPPCSWWACFVSAPLPPRAPGWPLTRGAVPSCAWR